MQFLNQLKLFPRQNCILLRNAVPEKANHAYGYKSSSKSENIPVVDLPLKPKKPCTAFFKFLHGFRKEYVKENPQCKITDVTKAASAIWKNYSTEKKAPFVEEYVKESLKYASDLIEYENSLTPEQKELIKHFNKVETAKKLEKKIKELNKPKAPPTSFSLFLSDSKADVKEYKAVKDWFRAKCSEWKNLPEDRKRKYLEQQRELSGKYLADLFKWEEEILNSTLAFTAPLKRRIGNARRQREYRKNAQKAESLK